MLIDEIFTDSMSTKIIQIVQNLVAG